MIRPYIGQFKTNENVVTAGVGYGDLSSAMHDIEKIGLAIETQCTRKVPQFINVKDSLSENTSTNLSAFESVCDSASNTIKSAIGSGFEGSTFYKEAKKMDDEIALKKYNEAMKSYNWALKKQSQSDEITVSPEEQMVSRSK